MQSKQGAGLTLLWDGAEGGMQQGGASGGWHLSVQENNPLLGNKEVDSTGLVAPSFLHFSALGPENIRPVEEQMGSTAVWFSAFDTPVKSACGTWFPACPQSLPPTAPAAWGTEGGCILHHKTPPPPISRFVHSFNKVNRLRC